MALYYKNPYVALALSPPFGGGDKRGGGGTARGRAPRGFFEEGVSSALSSMPLHELRTSSRKAAGTEACERERGGGGSFRRGTRRIRPESGAGDDAGGADGANYRTGASRWSAEGRDADPDARADGAPGSRAGGPLSMHRGRRSDRRQPLGKAGSESGPSWSGSDSAKPHFGLAGRQR